MGMQSIQATSGGGRRNSHRRRGRKHGVISEINVTPFVDVMLVLLIIFMVTAPLLTVNIPVDLPKTDAVQSNADNQPLEVTITADGRYYIQETEVGFDDLVPKLQQIRSTGSDPLVYVRGDKTVTYGTVAQVMARIRAGGYTKVALQTDPGS